MTAQQRKALTFYADLKTYQSSTGPGERGPIVMADQGKQARAALRSRRRPTRKAMVKR